MWASARVRSFIRHHQNTAIRLSAKLCNHESTTEERQRVEHLIFIHLNAARRAKRLYKYGK